MRQLARLSSLLGLAVAGAACADLGPDTGAAVAAVTVSRAMSTVDAEYPGKTLFDGTVSGTVSAPGNVGYGFTPLMDGFVTGLRHAPGQDDTLYFAVVDATSLKEVWRTAPLGKYMSAYQGSHVTVVGKNVVYTDSKNRIHALDLDALRAPDIRFWTLWDGDDLLGCGALRDLGDGHAEIKSMRTARAHRRRGVARMMLDHLLAQAQALSYARVSLETGSMAAFEPARALYASAGFQPCLPFADYLPDSNSVFMSRELPALAGRPQSQPPQWTRDRATGKSPCRPAGTSMGVATEVDRRTMNLDTPAAGLGRHTA